MFIYFCSEDQVTRFPQYNKINIKNSFSTFSFKILFRKMSMIS